MSQQSDEEFDEAEESEFEPTPQSREAFDWLASYGSHQVEDSMERMSRQVRELIPECVAMSLTVAQGELTFTMMIDRPGAALLDAMQYLAGGPCERAVAEGSLQATVRPPTDEGAWQMFAKAEAVAGIASTLSLPVMREGRTVGGVNLYASTANAFDGRHEELALICGAWAEGAVTNADLSFSSRIRASTAPIRLRDRGAVDVAIGYVAAFQNLDTQEAMRRIRDAAARADVSAADFARFILASHKPEDD
jgi:GAF domain-containing protein